MRWGSLLTLDCPCLLRSVVLSEPTEGQLDALRKMERLEQEQYVFLNPAHAEECMDQDWAEALPGRRYRLTEEGLQILRRRQ